MDNYDFTYTGAEIQAILDTAKKLKDSGYIFLGVATPSTNPGTPTQKVYYEAKQAGTYTNFGGAVLPDGISLLIWNGSWTSETVMSGDGGVFDISVYKSSGGTLATFADLAAALNGGNNIPVGARKGGMSVKFVQSSDNKYIQARLMANSFTTDVTQWQVVDDKPVAGSKNLVESGGVAKVLGMPTNLIWEPGSINGTNGNNNDSDLINRQRTGFISIKDLDTVIGASIWHGFIIYQYGSNKDYLNIYSSGWITSSLYNFINDLNVNCAYIRLAAQTTNAQTPQIQLEYSSGLTERVEKTEDNISFLDKDIYGVLEHNTEGVVWEPGSIRNDTGGDNNDSSILTTRQRTVGYISINNCDEITNYSSPFDYMILQYTEDKSYIGFIPSDYWRTSNWAFSDFLNENCKYIRICSKTVNSQTPTLILKKTAEKGVKEKVIELEGTVTNLSNDMYGSEERDTAGVEWQAGGINSNTGADNNDSSLLTTRQRTIGYIPVSECNKVSNYSSPFEYFVFQYNSLQQYIGFIPSDSWRTSDWEFKESLDANCAFIRIGTKTVNSQTPTLVLKKAAEEGIKEKVEQLGDLDTDTIIVDANGNGDYTSVADALANAGDTAVKHVTIIVRQGTYLMPPKVSGVAPYEENNRNLTIKGDDKYLCVLYNNIGFYDYTIGTDCAPLRLNGNVRIENLTIISRSTEFDNYVNTEGYVPRDDYRKASYCIHRDGTNPANTKFIVKDCILINDHMTCIGFGLRPNTELIIENIYAQCEQAAEHSKANDYGTIYGHYKANDKGLGQDLSIIRCQLVNKTSNQAINIMDAKAADATPQDTFGTFKFIGNAVNTTDKTTSLVIVSSIAGFYEIDGLSFDNAWE